MTTDCDYQLFPPLSDAEYAELKADIAERGVMVPVEYDEFGNVLDGFHRLQICGELGIKDYPNVVRYGLTDAEKRQHARKLNLARRHLNQAQKREVIADSLKDAPEKSDRQHAAELGVHQTTVGTVRKELEHGGQVSKLDTSKGADGKEYPRERKPVSLFNTTQKELAKATDEKVVKKIADGGSVSKKAVHVDHNDGVQEWYTPPVYLEAARVVMGSIDLDPATSEVAQREVQATTYFTAETNGLEQTWSGNVWMNPPYAANLVGKFSAKLCESIEAGSVSQAIVLVNNATETAWFQGMAAHASAICFPAKRVKFLDPEGNEGAPLQGQACIYFGDNAERFAATFSEFGFVGRL